MKYNYLCYFLVFIVTISCRQKDIPDVKGIDFPAAYVINGGSNTISIFDLNSLSVKNIIQLTGLGRFPHHITLSLDRKKLAVALPEFDFTQSHDALHQATGKKGGIIVIDALNGKTLLNIPMSKVNFNAAFSNDNNEIWTASSTDSKAMYVFDANTGAEKAVISLGSDPTEVIFSKDGNYAFVALGEGSFIVAINTQLKQIEKYIKVDPFPTNVWASNNGNIYVENKNLKTISIVDEQTLNTYEFIDVDFKPGQIAYNQSLDELWICQSGENKVAYFERKDNKWVLKSTIITDSDAHALTFSKNEKTAFVVNQQGSTISVIDANKHQKITDIKVGLLPNGIVLRE